MFPFDRSAAISIRAHTSFIAKLFRTVPFPSGYGCFNRPSFGRHSAKFPRHLSHTDSQPADRARPRKIGCWAAVRIFGYRAESNLVVKDDTQEGIVDVDLAL